MSVKEINKAAKSNLAKLLATENITVEHRKVETAYFDLSNRLLVVPIWKEMNVDILRYASCTRNRSCTIYSSRRMG